MQILKRIEKDERKRSKKKEMKIGKQEGITLIALVVTIVVLLILAGITLVIVFGENGVINQAKKAEGEQKIAEYKDKFELAKMTVYTKNHGSSVPIDQFWTELEAQGIDTSKKTENNGVWTITPEEGIEIKVTPTADGKNIEIEYLDGTGDTEKDPVIPTPDDPTANWDKTKVDVAEVLRKEGNTEKVKVPVPKGFTVSGVTSENTIDNGLVIYEGLDAVTDSNVETARNTRNQFVWVPVPEPSEMYGVTTDGKYLGKLYDFGSSSSPKNPPTARNWTETEGKISWTSETNYREPDVVTSNDNTAANYTNAGIKDKNGNAITTAAQFKAQLEEEFETMIKSVIRYKGFYIGRYETGSISETKAKVTKNNSDIHSQTWYTMYQKNKEMVEGKTSMIWGSQWDACMKWFLSQGEEKATYVTNSTGKGNYTGTQGSTDKLIPTGSIDSYSVNNIYDMAGNAWDRTIEARNTGFRVIRRRNLQRFRLWHSSFLQGRRQSDHF